MGKSSLRSLEPFHGSINVIVRFAANREVQHRTLQLSSPLRISGGLPAKNVSRPGSKRADSGPISVLGVARRCPIRSGAAHISGCRQVCSTTTSNSRLLPIYLWAPKPRGTPLLRREYSMKPCLSYLSFLRFCTQAAMPNNPVNRNAENCRRFGSAPRAASGYLHR